MKINKKTTLTTTKISIGDLVANVTLDVEKETASFTISKLDIPIFSQRDIDKIEVDRIGQILTEIYYQISNLEELKLKEEEKNEELN